MIVFGLRGQYGEEIPFPALNHHGYPRSTWKHLTFPPDKETPAHAAGRFLSLFFIFIWMDGDQIQQKLSRLIYSTQTMSSSISTRIYTRQSYATYANSSLT